MKRAFILVIAAILALSVLAGCGGARKLEIKKPEATGPQVEVTGSCSTSVSGKTVTVKATTNLMTGTKGRLSVVDERGTTLASEKVTFTENKEVSCTFTLEDEVKGKVHGFVVATPREDGKQTEQVYAKYGEEFENMKGKNVVWNNETVFLAIAAEAVEVK